MKKLLTAILLAAALPAQAADDVTYRKIKWDELGKFVTAQKGKVVVVDFWGTT